jgi:hypothetical protein
MAKVLNKIRQMQIKLNIINSNIDEIKNERNHFRENRKTTDDFQENKTQKKIKYIYTNDDSNNNQRNHLRNLKKNKTFHHLQNYQRNCNENENYSKFNNDFFLDNKIKRRNLSTKKLIDIKTKNESKKEYRTSSYVMNYNKRNDIINNEDKINFISDYYSKKPNTNNHLPKKHINGSKINLKRCLYNNNNNYYINRKGSVLTTTQKKVKIQKLVNENCNTNSNKILCDRKIMNKNNNKIKTGKIFSGLGDYYNYEEKKNAEMNVDDNISGNINKKNTYNNFYNQYNVYENSKTSNNSSHKSHNFFKSNSTKKFINNQKSINNNITENNYNNYKIQRKMSIDNIKKSQNSIKNRNDINYKQMISDIIEISNEYNNKENKINVDNIIDEYKLLLRNIKIKDNFILKLINKYNNSTNSNLNNNDPNSLVSIWNWINSQNNNWNNEDKQYKLICQEIMEQNNLNNIQDLKEFLNKSINKMNTNENFLMSIKRILST